MAQQAVRALSQLNGRGFGIAQTGPRSYFYELKADGTATTLGTLPGDRRPQIIEGNLQLLILAGGLGYGFDLATSTLTRITDPEFPIGAFKGGFINGQFLVGLPNSQTFAYSGVNDVFSWDGLDFADVEGTPGNIVTFVIDHLNIFFFCNNHAEIFINSGIAATPFTRFQGAYMEQGAAGQDVAFKCDNTLFWIGKNDDGEGIVWRNEGYQPERVSTYPIENLIRKYGPLTNVTGYPHQERGHTFARWDFPDARDGNGASLLYDVGVKMWHERFFWNAVEGVYMGDLARCHMYCFGKHLVGDWRSSSVYEMSAKYKTDAGAAIRRIRTSPDISNGGQWIFYGEHRLLIEAGMGLDGGGGEAAAVYQTANQLIRSSGGDDDDWDWTAVLSILSVNPGFGPPWYCSSVTIGPHSGLTLLDGGTFSITGTSATFGPVTVALSPTGTTTLAISPAIKMDNSSVVTFASTGASVNVESGIQTVLALASAASVPPGLPAGGVSAGDGLDPVIIIQLSNDGGKTWGRERSIKVGKKGDYQKLVNWQMNGRSLNRCLRVICTEPINAGLISLDMDATPGT